MNMKTALAAAVALSFLGTAQAAPLQNTSFENGLASWSTLLGTASAVSSGSFGGVSVSPKDGSFMAEMSTTSGKLFDINTLFQSAASPLGGGYTLWYRMVSDDHGSGSGLLGDTLGILVNGTSLISLYSKNLGTGDSGWKSFTLPSGTTSIGFSLLGDSDSRKSYAFFDISPVPEPGEWAMILAGLGLVGTMARRRSLKG